MVILPMIMLQLLWLVPPSSSNLLDPSVLEGNAPSCYNRTPIQYPFAVTDNGSVSLTPLRGFEIECNVSQGSGPMLKLGSDRYPLLNISLDDGYVRIAGRAFAWQCNGNSSGDSREPNHVLNLTDTPYTFSSTRNKFTATGCDAMAQIHGSGSSGGDDKQVSTGCVSFCVDPEAVIGGVCSGVGCCQAPVPPGLKSFKLDFKSVRGLINGSRNESAELPCSKAFIVDSAWYNFSYDDLKGYHDDEYRPVFLDWAIGNQSCKEVRNATDYACKGNSHCNDSQDRVGYRCICNQGYHGNPYNPGGCEGSEKKGWLAYFWYPPPLRYAGGKLAAPMVSKVWLSRWKVKAPKTMVRQSKKLLGSVGPFAAFLSYRWIVVSVSSTPSDVLRALDRIKGLPNHVFFSSPP